MRKFLKKGFLFRDLHENSIIRDTLPALAGVLILTGFAPFQSGHINIVVVPNEDTAAQTVNALFLLLAGSSCPD